MERTPGPTVVLIVEDEETVREPLRELLTQAGHNVVAAASAAAAIKLLNTVRPDVVLLDLALPGVHGTEVLRAMDDQPAVAAPVVLVTGAPPREWPRSTHVVDAVPKPFTAARLLSSVEQQLAPALAS